MEAGELGGHFPFLLLARKEYASQDHSRGCSQMTGVPRGRAGAGKDSRHSVPLALAGEQTASAEGRSARRSIFVGSVLKYDSNRIMGHRLS